MGKSERVFFFTVAVAALSLITLGWQGQLFPTGPVPVLIYSALLMVSVSSLFLENYFTRPSDVIASGIAALLAIAPLRQELIAMGNLYDAYFIYVLLNVVLALIALLLLTADEEQKSAKNEIASLLFNVSTKFGNGKVIFLFLFLIAAVSYVDTDSFNFLVLVFYAGALLTINPKRSLLFPAADKVGQANEIGEVIGVQSGNRFLVRLFKERTATRRFDLVEFRYVIGSTKKLFKGFVIDNYLMNGKRWAEIYTDDEVVAELGKDPLNLIERDNVLYRCDVEQSPSFLERFVGIVAEDSRIDSIRFEYQSKVSIEEGSLVATAVRGEEVFYQVTQGVTRIESLESKDERGLVVGSASQLGRWNSELLVFEKFGWVPKPNSRVYAPPEIEPVHVQDTELLVGYVPGTKFPVLLNKETAVTHHMAILGVTGTGKSVFSRHLLRDIISDGTKVVCVDFTGEYVAELSDLAPVGLITPTALASIKTNIDWLEVELAKFPNQQDRVEIAVREMAIAGEFLAAANSFVASSADIGVFELPDLSNSLLTLRYVQLFFKSLFEMAKGRPSGSPNICIVLEEAHTIIPETNAMGTNDRSAAALVNSIGQIALQGRKYGVGFIVIGQRTANISKTVLTQCNTLVVFQQFDKTSTDFLANYVGSEYAATIRNLKPRTAVAIGKAFRSGMPVILEVPQLTAGGKDMH